MPDRDRPALDVEEIASALLGALNSYSDRNLVQGSPDDALIDGTFDLTTVVQEFRTRGSEIRRRA